MKYYTLNIGGTSLNVIPVMHTYKPVTVENILVDNVLAVELVTTTGITVDTITVNIPEAFAAIDFPKNASFIDTNNCPWAIEFINKNNLGTITDWTWPSGFCTYPMCFFDIDKLVPYQPTIYDMGVKE